MRKLNVGASIPRAAPETTPLWRLFLIKLSLSLSLSQPARAQAVGGVRSQTASCARASPACCAGRCGSSTARRAYAHKCMAMRLSGGGPPLRCSRSSPRSHARCKGSHTTPALCCA